MTLSTDALLDRMYLKSQLTRWRIGAIIALIIAALSWVHQSEQFTSVRDHVARIRIEGVLNDDPKAHDVLMELAEDKRAKAVIVYINSPGGSVVGGEQLYLDFRKIAEKKPVVILMRELAASAAYMGALGGDYMLAREGTLTGSIGVLLQSAEFTDMASKLGITPITIKSAPLKATPSPFEKVTPEAKRAVEIVIENFFAYFKNLVAERRKLAPGEVEKLADGRVFTGRQALELKLIDGIGGEEEARAWLTEKRQISKDLPAVDVGMDKNTPSWLASAQAFFGLPPARMLDGLVSIWQ